MSLVSISLSLLSIFENKILNDIRSYVRGESLYSRGSQNAVHALKDYIRYKEQEYFDTFIEEISIPLGDKMAREALLLEKPDKEKAFQGFLRGENHPKDIEGMIFFLLTFKQLYYVEEAIKHWTNADKANLAIFDLGNTIKTMIEMNSSVEVAPFIEKLKKLKNDADDSQESFSEVLSEGARWVEDVLVFVTVVSFFFLMLIGLFFTRRILNDLDKNDKQLKNSQEKLTQQYYLVENIIDNIPTRVFWKNKDGTYLGANKVFLDDAKLSSKKEIIGKSDFEMPWGETEAKLSREDDLKVMHNNTPILNFEEVQTDNDGNVIHFLTSKIPLKNSSENIIGILGTYTDITEQKKFQESILAAKEAADTANKTKSDFLASMSHEIRTPMTGLLGFIQRLKNTEQDPERLKQFDVVENSGQTLLSIINDILDFSKIESGKVSLEHSPYSLKKIFNASLDIYASLASTKNISLHSMIDENIPSCLMGDETRLKQIVFNLLSNAIKFTNENGKVTLNARYYSDKQKIYIGVVDTGIGIAKENLTKIFEAFTQEDISTTRKFGGTGLGLSISSRLVKQMGSALQVVSKVGKGSKFYFEIAVDICSDASLNDTVLEETSSESSQTLQGHVLVVEDNKTNQMLMGIILNDIGLTYDIANNGAEGVLNFKLNKYDIVLMDENMPIMNGIEATKHIREIEEEQSSVQIPIIAVTANALTGDKEKFIESGMNDYIPKPYSEEDIVKVLQKYLKKVQ